MRKIVIPALFALVAACQSPAQAPANTENGQSIVPQTQNGTDQSAMPAANGIPGQPAAQNPVQPATATQENPNSALGPRPAGGDVPAGTEIRATLDTPLSSKTSRPGDRFTATISQPVQNRNGVIIPVGSRVEGEVSESEEGRTAAALRGKGKLNLRLRDIILPNGQTVSLTASLVSVNTTNGRHAQQADNEGQVESGIEGKTAVRDMGMGAGVGTFSSLIFGAPLKGMAVGTLAGGGYVLSTNGKDVRLPAQTGMVIRLEQPLGGQ
jgi:hypothetical protein